MATTMTSRQFNQDASRAKRAAAEAPVFVTDRGRPAFVLMSIEDYRRLTGQRTSIADALAMDGEISDELDRILVEIREESRRETPRPVDFD